MRSSFTAAPAVTPGGVMADERALCPSAIRLRALSIDRLGADRAIELVGLAPSLNDALCKLEKIAKYGSRCSSPARAGRQGILRPGRAPVRRGPPGALRPRQLSAIPGRQPHRQRAVRPYPRQLHGRGGRSQGRLRGGRRRRHLPRRDRGSARQCAGHAAARPRHRRVPSGRRDALAGRSTSGSCRRPTGR